MIYQIKEKHKKQLQSNPLQIQSKRKVEVMSLPRWTETLEEYCQLIPIQPQVQELSNKEIFEWQFEPIHA